MGAGSGWEGDRLARRGLRKAFLALPSLSRANLETWADRTEVNEDNEGLNAEPQGPEDAEKTRQLMEQRSRDFGMAGEGGLIRDNPKLPATIRANP